MRRAVLTILAFALLAGPAQAARDWVGPEVIGKYGVSGRFADIAGDGTTVTVWTRGATYADHYGFYPAIHARVNGGSDNVIGSWAGPKFVAAGRGGQAMVAWNQSLTGSSGQELAHAVFAQPDGTFSAPQLIDGATVVAADMNERGAAAMVIERGAYDAPEYDILYRPPGGTFDTPATLPSSTVSHLWMTPAGEAVVHETAGDASFLSTRAKDGPVSAPHPLDQAGAEGVEVAGDAQGHVLAAWTTPAGGALALRGVDGQWTPVRSVAGPVAVAANERGDALAAWTVDGIVHLITADLAAGTFSKAAKVGTSRLRRPEVAVGADGSALLAAERGPALVIARRNGLGAFGEPTVASCAPTATSPLTIDDGGVAHVFDGMGLVHDAPATRPQPRTCEAHRSCGRVPVYSPAQPVPGATVTIDLRCFRATNNRFVSLEPHFHDGGKTVATGTPGVIRHTFPSAGDINWEADITEVRRYGDVTHFHREHFAISVFAPLTLIAVSEQSRVTVRDDGLLVRAGAATAVEAAPVTLTVTSGTRVLTHRSLVLGPEPVPVRLDLGRHPPATVTVRLQQGKLELTRTVRIR
jgi:hypothetical protein